MPALVLVQTMRLRGVRPSLAAAAWTVGYGEAAAKALPRAIQVADRWHLMENASAAFLDAVRKSMRAIREALGATTRQPRLTHLRGKASI